MFGVGLLVCVFAIHKAVAYEVYDHAKLLKMKTLELVKLMRAEEFDEDEIDLALDLPNSKESMAKLLVAKTQSAQERSPEAISGAWIPPNPAWRPPKQDYKKRFVPGPNDSPQAMLGLGVWFVNTSDHTKKERGSEKLVRQAIRDGADLEYRPVDGGGQTALFMALVSGSAFSVPLGAPQVGGGQGCFLTPWAPSHLLLPYGSNGGIWRSPTFFTIALTP